MQKCWTQEVLEGLRRTFGFRVEQNKSLEQQPPKSHRYSIPQEQDKILEIQYYRNNWTFLTLHPVRNHIHPQMNMQKFLRQSVPVMFIHTKVLPPESQTTSSKPGGRNRVEDTDPFFKIQDQDKTRAIDIGSISISNTRRKKNHNTPSQWDLNIGIVLVLSILASY